MHCTKRMREIITLQVGQAGCQLSQAVWELACLEHGLNLDGRLEEYEDPMKRKGDSIDSMFKPCVSGNYSPRSLLIDLEPSVVGKNLSHLII